MHGRTIAKQFHSSHLLGACCLFIHHRSIACLAGYDHIVVVKEIRYWLTISQGTIAQFSSEQFWEL